MFGCKHITLYVLGVNKSYFFYNIEWCVLFLHLPIRFTVAERAMKYLYKANFSCSKDKQVIITLLTLPTCPPLTCNFPKSAHMHLSFIAALSFLVNQFTFSIFLLSFTLSPETFYYFTSLSPFSRFHCHFQLHLSENLL